MSDFKCSECERDFSSQEGLDQHNMAKHGVGSTRHELKQAKKQEKEMQKDLERRSVSRSKLIRRGAYVAIPLILIVAAFMLVSSRPPATTGNSIDLSDIPKSPIHWHPTLSIVINGEQQSVPANLGLTGAHMPVHTHDATGVIHYEINNPTPENMPLRYFFENVWRKRFNSDCIMDYCNGTLKMYVNGEENHEFENYIPKDKDEIVIEFN